MINKPKVICYPNNKDTSIILEVNFGALNVASCTEAHDYTFVLDLSGSMNAHMTELKKSMFYILENMPRGISFAIVAFGTTASVLFETFEYSVDQFSQCAAALNHMRSMGTTNLNAGIKLANEIASKRHDPRNTQLLILTDGQANIDETNPLVLAAKAASVCGTVLSIMFTAQSSAQFSDALHTINPNNSAHFVMNGDALQSTFSNIFSIMKQKPAEVTVGEHSKAIPSSCMSSTLHLLFDAIDVSKSHKIEVLVDGVSVFKAESLDVTVLDADERLLSMHTRTAKAYQKLGGLISSVREQSTGGGNPNDILQILEAPEAEEFLFVAKELSNEFEDLGIAETPAYRSLLVGCDSLETLKKTIAPPPHVVEEPFVMDNDAQTYPNMFPGVVLPVPPPDMAMLDDDDDDAPTYRSSLRMPASGQVVYRPISTGLYGSTAPTYRSLPGSLFQGVPPSYRSLGAGASGSAAELPTMSVHHQLVGLPSFIK
tara:strand:+ start:901 stop:2358 length:1458 start_codon:yes stop_codon:yes gene_type:complete